jgi:hypothetical protein
MAGETTRGASEEPVLEKGQVWVSKSQTREILDPNQSGGIVLYRVLLKAGGERGDGDYQVPRGNFGQWIKKRGAELKV